LAILLGAGLFAALMLVPGCGSGGQNQQQQQQLPPATATSYNVVVTGTANGIIHNAKVLVMVQ
jgi:hypothetical protein